jgi:hypothetical protein
MLVELQLYPLHVKLRVLTSIINCVMILLYVPSVLKDLGLKLGCNLYFYHHIDYIFSQGLEKFGPIRDTTFFFTVDNICVLYTTLVRPKLEHAYVAWNSIHRQIHPNSKEFKGNLLPYATAEFLWAYIAKTVKVH